MTKTTEILIGVCCGLGMACVFMFGYWLGFHAAATIAKEHISKMADANLQVLKKVLDDR